MTDQAYGILFALYSVALVFCSVMSARAYYLRRIQELEEALALRRILRTDNESGNQEPLVPESFPVDHGLGDFR